MSEGHTSDQGLLNKDTARAVFRYAMKPDILPRLRALGLHFGHFAYLLALVLNSARLIPMGHPTLQASNIGRFGIRQVLAIAANNITWSTRNIDQIAIYVAIVLGLIMVVIQAFVIMAMAVFGGAAQAAATPTVGPFFSTPSANVPTDVVLIMLEQVFGPNLSFFGAASTPLGTPVYDGLHAILSLYSMAMMIIAAVIVIYYLMTVVGEAAKSGTPFGQRFNSLWAPIRLVAALGLLVPLGSGLNSAQYLTLGLAKMGSGLGTMVWTEFVGQVTAATDIIAKPDGESVAALVERVFLNEVCAESFNQIEGGARTVKPLQVIAPGSSVAADFASPATMISAAQMADMEAVVISWSHADAGDDASDFACGRISVPLTEFDVFASSTSVTAASAADKWWWKIPFIGPNMDNRLGQVHEDVKHSYLSEIGRLTSVLRPEAKKVAAAKISINATPAWGDLTTLSSVGPTLTSTSETAHTNINNTMKTTYASITGSSYAHSGGYDEMVKRGWGAAGLWYGTLGTINRKYMDAVSSAIPSLDVLFAAADVAENERGALGRLFGVSRYNLGRGATGEIENAISFAQADFASYVRDAIVDGSPLYESTKFEVAHEAGRAGWLAKTMIYIIGGSNALTRLKDEPTLDPMVRLANAGHGMVKKSMVAVGLGSAMGIGGAVLATANDPRANLAGEALGAVSAIMFVIAGIGLTAGIFLAFILPIIPFVYFAFAVIGWVLEIFEAVIAMPLWALAHLRIDGDGMPGQGALPGYQLLLMILLRPALIVMGLVGGYVIFGAATYFFASLFNAATAITQEEIAQNSMGAIGLFVYTIIYTFLVYNIALMCFKMIDDVPKGMLRWLGSGAQPFSDSRGDPISGSREIVVAAGAAALGMSRGLKGGAGGLHDARTNLQKRQKHNASEGRDKNDNGYSTEPNPQGGSRPS